MENSTVKTSLSIEREIHDKGVRLARVRGFRHSFSAWITMLVEREVRAAEASGELGAATPPEVVDAGMAALARHTRSVRRKERKQTGP